MPFVKNDNRINRNGRPKGSKNWIPTDLRQRISKYVDENFEQIIEDMKVMDPRDRVAVYLKFIEYVLPKLQSVNTDENDNNTVIIVNE